MVKVKHFMDAAEADDGERLWVEPVKLVGEFREWCHVDGDSLFVPPRALSDWFETHPDGYDYFRARYHEYLSATFSRDALIALARTALHENVTLLHQGSDPNENAAVALHEYLGELQAYCSRDSD